MVIQSSCDTANIDLPVEYVDRREIEPSVLKWKGKQG